MEAQDRDTVSAGSGYDAEEVILTETSDGHFYPADDDLPPFPDLESLEIPPGFLSSGDNIDEPAIERPVENVTPIRDTTGRGGRRRRISADNSPSPDDSPRDAKAGPPSLDEWTKFFSRIALRLACDWYLSFAFRGIDEDLLTDREIERLAMTDDERKRIAVPFAELSHKSKFMRKHGRMIVSSGDAFDAAITFGAWMSRVNRIANRYRKRDIRVNGATANGSSGPSSPQAGANGYSTVGTHGGRFPDGFNGRVYGPGSG